MNHIGEDHTACLKEIKKNNFTLNADKKIKNDPVFKHTMYTYTLCTCIDYIHSISDQAILGALYETFKSIGFYRDTGLYKYCDTPITYGVPNTTGAAAFIYSLIGDIDNCRKCVEFLRNAQHNGNWQYWELGKSSYKKIPNQWEDTLHVAMIVFYLRMVQQLTDLDVESIYLRSIELLKYNNKHHVHGGQIGMGVPYVYLATKGIDEDLSERAFNQIMSDSIRHENFRVRSLAAYCLVKEYH